MSRFAELAEGTLARRTVIIPISGVDEKIDVRVLAPIEWGEVLEGARKFAVERGVANPTEDDPIYEMGLELHVIVRACIDSESPHDEPQPYFTSVEQILRSRTLRRDHIALLYAHQEAWEHQCSPRPAELTPAEFTKVITEGRAGNLGPFFLLRQSMQGRCLHSLAVLYFDSQARSSGSTSSP